MTLQTKLPGSSIQSGSIPVSAITNFTGELSASLPPNVVSSSAQVTAFLPTDTVSSSIQVTAFLPTGTVSSSIQLPSGIASSSAQVIAYLPQDTVSSSAQVTTFLPTGTVSSSTQLPSGIASSSAQVKTYLPTDTVSSSAQVIAFLPSNTVSSSGQINVFNTIGGSALATTGSNTFTAPQTISDNTNTTNYLDGALHVAGGMSVRQDVRVSGSLTVNGLLTAVSMSTLYVTASEYTIGTSKIILNDDDLVRFAGLSIVDSGSSSPATASIYWDSMKHKFIYENLSGSAYNSAILIAGPKNVGTLGDEVGLTSGYVPYATGDDHISDSVIFQSGSKIGIGTTTVDPATTVQVVGSIKTNANVVANTFWPEDGIRKLTNNSVLYFRNAGGDSEVVINGSGGVGIGTTNPSTKLDILTAAGANGIRVVRQNTFPVTGYGLVLDSVNDEYSNYAGIQFNAGGTEQASIRQENTGNIYFDSRVDTYLRPAGSLIIRTNNTERMRIDSSGNVGVGTTSPTALLDVNGNSTIRGTLVVSGSGQTIHRIQSTGTSGYPVLVMSNTNASATAANYFSISVARDNADSEPVSTLTLIANDTTVVNRQLFAINNYASRVFTVTANGNIGVGTTNPLLTAANRGNLTINGTSDSIVTLGVNGSYAGYLYATSSKVELDAGSGRYLQFNTDGNIRAVIASDGSVGIGTTIPVTKLDVRGNSYFGVNGTDGGIHIRGYNSAVSRFNTNAGASGNYNGLRIDSNLNNSNSLSNWVVDIGGFDQIGRPGTQDTFNVGRVPSGGSISTYFLVNSSGLVGIGTTSPSTAMLHLYYNSVNNRGIRLQDANGIFDIITSGGGQSHSLGLYDETNNAYRLFILSNGNVGIGTTNPGSLLDIGSTSNAQLQFSYSSTIYGRIGRKSNGDYEFSAYENGADIIFGTSTSNSSTIERMRIDDSGNVYVTNPTAAGVNSQNLPGKLGLSGYGWNTNLGSRTIAAALSLVGEYESFTGSTEPSLTFSLQGSGGGNIGPAGPSTMTERMRITNSGNVGIGTTSPTAKLDVFKSGASYTDTLILSNEFATGANQGIAWGSSTNISGRIKGVDDGSYGTHLIFETRTTGPSTSTTEQMRVTANGKVGIGTTNPDDKFQVNGGNIRVSANTTSGTFLDIVPSATQADGVVLSTSFYGGGAYGPLRINTGGSEKVRVTSGGNVGIGTTDPQGSLDVAGQTIVQGGVYTRRLAFSVPANANRRIRVALPNYTAVRVILGALRTNSGDSVVYWEGVLNVNDNTAYSTVFNSRTSSGTISYTLTVTSGSTSTFDFDFNNAGSSGGGTITLIGLFNTGFSITETTY